MTELYRSVKYEISINLVLILITFASNYITTLLGVSFVIPLKKYYETRNYNRFCQS